MYGLKYFGRDDCIILILIYKIRYRYYKDLPNVRSYLHNLLCFIFLTFIFWTNLGKVKTKKCLFFDFVFIVKVIVRRLAQIIILSNKYDANGWFLVYNLMGLLASALGHFSKWAGKLVRQINAGNIGYSHCWYFSWLSENNLTFFDLLVLMDIYQTFLKFYSFFSSSNLIQ